MVAVGSRASLEWAAPARADSPWCLWRHRMSRQVSQPLAAVAVEELARVAADAVVGAVDAVAELCSRRHCVGARRTSARVDQPDADRCLARHLSHPHRPALTLEHLGPAVLAAGVVIVVVIAAAAAVAAAVLIATAVAAVVAIGAVAAPRLDRHLPERIVAAAEAGAELEVEVEVERCQRRH